MPPYSSSASETQASSNFEVTNTPNRRLARVAVHAAQDKLAKDITVIDMRTVSGIADYFVLCTGESDVQVKAIKKAVVDQIDEEYDERPWHIEGESHLQWVVVDYVDVVVHVLMPDKREFYALERLWGDADMSHVEGDQDEIPVLETEVESGDDES